MHVWNQNKNYGKHQIEGWNQQTYSLNLNINVVPVTYVIMHL